MGCNARKTNNYWQFIIVIFYLRTKLEYASPVWNNITATDANKLERVQGKFAALCFIRFFPHISYNYAYALELLKLHTLQVGRFHFDALFFLSFQDLNIFLLWMIIVFLDFMFSILGVSSCSIRITSSFL